MKVYVDELPKSCKDCPCFEYNEYWDKCYCSGRGEIEDKYKKRQDCHLLSLADYTKQVRKEVVQEIKSAIKEKLVYPDNRVDCPFSDGFAFEDTICDVIDQIQGETK